MNKYTLLIILVSLMISCKSDDVNYAKLGINDVSIKKIKALPVGSKAPDFVGKDQNGKAIKLSEITNSKEAIIVFYRGYWCGICSKHLSEFENSLKQIQDKGAQVIAITPELPMYRDSTILETHATFPIISDKDNQIMNDYGVTFKANEEYSEKFVGWVGKSIKEVNGQSEDYLPIPATYIIDKNMKIKWSHFDPNYKERSSVKDILAQL